LGQVAIIATPPTLNKFCKNNFKPDAAIRTTVSLLFTHHSRGRNRFCVCRFFDSCVILELAEELLPIMIKDTPLWLRQFRPEANGA
jgi:hypothetical protein